MWPWPNPALSEVPSRICKTRHNRLYSTELLKDQMREPEKCPGLQPALGEWQTLAAWLASGKPAWHVVGAL